MTPSDGLVKLEQIVPELEWATEGYAKTPFGYYSVIELGDNDLWAFVWHEYPYGDPEGSFATVDEAKAAAEADYRARIASALNIDPILSEIKRMREALAQIGDIHRNLSIIDALASDRLTGHILRAREIADEALSTLSPQEPDNG